MPCRICLLVTGHATILSCLLGVLQAVSCPAIRAQGQIIYDLRYSAPGDHRVSMKITAPALIAAPATLVIPRTYPGGYSQVPYDSFLENVTAVSQDGKLLPCTKEANGPRWKIGQRGENIAHIEYQVDITDMENQLLSAVDTSKVRPRYVGLLGYSIFAYVDGLERDPITLQVSAPETWPVVTTLDPQVEAPKSTARAEAADYYALADSEVLLGPDLRLRKLDGKIGLIMTVYAECEENIEADGKLAREALDRVQEYFGDKPFTTYTVQLELLRPIAGHDYNFSQEHIDSGTFSLSTDRAINAQSSLKQRETNLFNYAHHMAHSWIPKRAYGVGYRPFTWEMPPVIDTIWFNEGFGRYAALEALVAGMPAADGRAFREDQLFGFHGIIDSAPPFLRHLPMVVLSREASFLYSTDFRTGMNVFARGALMAAEMDERIRSKTQGKKSLRDGLRALLSWTARNQKPFQIEDMPTLLSNETGVDVRDILDRWMAPQP
jgi:predicted metalloprotease with PDZ domain